MDERLISQARLGDEEAFASLTESLVDRFHAVARNILRDPALADDAVQAALVRVWRDLPRLREPQRFEAWTYRLLVNACYSEARRARRWTPSIRGRPGSEPMTADGTGLVADRDELERGFRRLPMDQRAVVVLHHYLDLSREESAEVLGIPLGTVHSRLRTAMRLLRSALDADGRPASSDATARALAR